MSEEFNEIYNRVSTFVDGQFDLTRLKGREVSVPNNIVVLGAGGTASWFAPKLAKIVNDALRKGLLTSGNMNTVNICFIDGDDIEEKNLIRQNFIGLDITKNKAEVIHGRYGRQIDPSINCGFIDKYLSNKKYQKIKPDVASRFADVSEIGFFANIERKNILFLNLIDNAITRKVVHLTAADCKTGVVIDVANNEYNGQLTTSVYYSPNYINNQDVDVYKSWFYNELSEQLDMNDNVSVFSCADADEESVDQLFNANDMAATVLGNYFNDWLVTKKLYFGRVDFVTGSNMSVVNSNRFYDENFVGMVTNSDRGVGDNTDDETEFYYEAARRYSEDSGVNMISNNALIRNEYIQKIKGSM